MKRPVLSIGIFLSRQVSFVLRAAMRKEIPCQAIPSGRPYAIRATADRTILSGDRATAHITVEVVDEEGAVVKLGDNEITCAVEGPARLLGLEGSDNSDMSDYTDNRHRVYHGRLLAYIQTTGGEGTVKVRFASPLLKGSEV